jgi:uncharacterized protein
VVELEATMRDGMVLRADLYRPSGLGPWPVLLARTPYGKKDPGVLARLDPARAADRGYLVIIQDCRGRFSSEGQWRPLAHEEADGYDTIVWAASLPEANGRVGMYGPSYLGHTQWAAIAAGAPQLLAAAPEFTWSDPHDGLITRGGAYELGLMTHWTLTLGYNVLERRHAGSPAELRRRLTELDSALANLTTHTYWELPPAAPLRRLALPTPISPRPDSRPCPAVPTLIVAGWFDSFLQGSLDNYARLRENGTPAALIVGPWSHGNQTSRIGETDFGAAANAATLDATASLLDRELDWLDQHLKHGPPSTASRDLEPPVLLFLMGANEWRRLPIWPPESVQTSWYLHADGSLAPHSPTTSSPPHTLRHDPDNPVPTHGGALLLSDEFPAGQFDQRQIEQRDDDVLVYTSAPLQAPLEVVGRVLLHLTAESSAPSSDWIARLCDVDPNGVSRNITDGILRTSPAHATCPRQATELLIDLWSTAHVFQPGHRIRLQIAASCFPRWDRNGTTVARQAVHHAPATPSRLVLPVVESAESHLVRPTTPLR